MKRAWRALAVLGIAASGAVAVVSAFDADAQPRRPRPVPTVRPTAPRRDAGAPNDGGLEAAAPADPRPAQPLSTAQGSTVDAGVVEVKTMDGGVQVFNFGEVDIEGRLKSPSLLYFLRRVRAEFSAGDLGHRSFLRELSETRKGQSF